MSYIFPINWPRRPPRIGEAKEAELLGVSLKELRSKKKDGSYKPPPPQPFKQRCIVVKAKHDGKGPQLKVDFNNGPGTVELPKELCKKDDGSNLVPDESKAPDLFKAIREWAATVSHPELMDDISTNTETDRDRP